MNLYEAMFLLDPTFGASMENCESEIRRLLGRAEAEVVFIGKWDERRLAYRINGRKRGVYVLVYFKAPTDKIAGLVRDVQISEEILRLLVLRADDVTREMMELLGDDLRAVSMPSHIFDRGRRIRFPLSPLNLAVNLGPVTCARAGLEMLRQTLSRREPDVNFETQMLQSCEVDVVTVVCTIKLNMFTMLKSTASDNHGVILHAVRAFFFTNTQGAGNQTNRLIQ